MLAITRLANSSAGTPRCPVGSRLFRVRTRINKRLQFRVQRLDRGRIKLSNPNSGCGPGFFTPMRNASRRAYV